ncbi:SLAM family member 9-like isoform X2 [Pseudophryne corroboree]|uniref:SLAM family member 9-like isoform X2 n=1 Tax=Pseudophryne corroboree TaxID=495146 RepID=UPI003081E0FB
MIQLSILVFVILQTGVLCDDPCAERPVPGIEGGDVTLQLGQTEIEIRFISWTLLPNAGFIATTKPGRFIDNVSGRYVGRVSSAEDGSLHITDLTAGDQRSYVASIQRDGGEECLHFNLTVYKNLSPDDIQISHNVTSSDPCLVTLMCTVTVRDVTVTWGSIDSSDINVTGDVLYVPPSHVNFTYTCNARNPISDASKTVVPQQYCNTESPQNQGESDRHHLIIAGCTIIVVIIIVTGCLLWRRKRMKRKETATEIHTTYGQVADVQKPAENHYDSSERREESSVTVYSEVMPVQQRKPQKQENGKQNVQPAPETVYDLVRTVPVPK